MTGPPLVEVRARRRLASFDLDVEFASAATRTVIFGPSGGGKSMTLRAIAGTARLDSGRIVVSGRVLFDSAASIDVPSHARKVGLVPQGYALFPHLTIAQNILYGAARTSGKAGLLADLLALIDLQGFEARRPSELSGGQQQRVALARALAAAPQLLLLDEPFSALDASLRRALRDEVVDIQKRTQVPLITVTHDLQDAFELGDQIVVIDKGKVVQQGSRDDLFYRPLSRRVAELVGIRNLLEVEVVATTGAGLTLRWCGHVLEAAAGAAPLAPGDTVTVGVRSSQVMVVRPEEAQSARANVIAGRIVEEIVTPEGYRLRLQAAAGGSLEIELSGYAYFRLGLDSRKDVRVSIRPDALHVISASPDAVARPPRGAA